MMLSLSPPDRASVCNGDLLKVNCNTSGNFLRWNITLQLVINESISTITVIRIIASDHQYPKQIPVRVGNSWTTITLSRSSTLGVTPLTSTLLINPVSAILNGSIVTCSEIVQGGYNGESSTTVIHVEDFHNFCKL